MKVLKVIAVLYMFLIGTVTLRGQITRQSVQDTELHDWRAAQLQIRLLELQISQARMAPEKKGTGHEL